MELSLELLPIHQQDSFPTLWIEERTKVDDPTAIVY